MSPSELTVIIPTLDEEAALPGLLQNLARQSGVTMELVVADGGSADATVALAHSGSLPVNVIHCKPGRSRQLNAGANMATGEYLLFLHADSRFPEELAIRKGIDQLRRASADNASGEFAGHFSLSFRRNDAKPSLAYCYYESKARLNRRGCSHGDQGILISRRLFREAGPFTESCQLLAETRLADQLRQQGQWLLLTPEILSSARRFEREGLKQRQTLNAVIMACGAAGWDHVIERIPALYRLQRQTAALSVRPFLAIINAEIKKLSPADLRRFWEQIGTYVRDNAWQIAFCMDVRRRFNRNGGELNGELSILDFYDRHGSRFIANRLGTRCATVLTRIWFRFMLGSRGKC